MDSKIKKLLDSTGRKIIELLIQDARLSYAEIGRQVHLSTPAVIERIEKLETAGIITGYQAQINPKLLGYDVSAFVTLTTDPAYYDIVTNIVNQTLEIESCDHVTGSASFILRIRAKSVQQIEVVIQQFNSIGTTDTTLILSSFKSSNASLQRLSRMIDEQ